MYCRFCGAKIEDNSNYCPVCGKNLQLLSEAEDSQDSKVDWIRLVSDFSNSSSEQKNFAFERLYNASYKPLFAYIQKYTHNTQATEDALQNAYLTCLSKIDQLDNATNFLPWMKQIAFNEYLKTVRKNSREVEIEPISDEEGNEADSVELTPDDTMLLPEDAYENVELQDLLLGSINELTERQRIIIKGFYFDEKPIRVLAEELDMPVNTVKAHLLRGRKALQKKVRVYANAYGLNLVPLAVVPFLAILAKKDVLACEAAVAGGSAVLAAVESTARVGIADTAAGAAGASSSGAGASAGLSSSGTAAVGKAAASTASTASKVAGGTAIATGKSVGTSVAVKIGIGITAAAVAAGGTGAYLYVQNSSRSASAESAYTTEQSTEIAETASQEPSTAPTTIEEQISPDEMLENTYLQDLDSIYGGFAERDLDSPYWIENIGNSSNPYYAIRTGNYHGEGGVIAEFKKDLDRDDQNEILVFYRQKDTQNRSTEGNSAGSSGAFNIWTINVVVYDIDNGSVFRSDPQEIRTIGDKDAGERTVGGLYDAYGLVVYTKQTGFGSEILCLNYGTAYLNADGTEETFTEYRYDGKEIYESGSVDFAGSDAYGVGEDADFINKLRTMGLEKSANQIQSSDNFLAENTNVNGKVGYYFGMLALNEDNITNEFELYTVSNIDTNKWNAALINGDQSSFDVSGYTSSIKSVVYDDH